MDPNIRRIYTLISQIEQLERKGNLTEEDTARVEGLRTQIQDILDPEPEEDNFIPKAINQGVTGMNPGPQRTVIEL